MLQFNLMNGVWSQCSFEPVI